MKGGQPAAYGVVAAFFLALGGCSIGSGGTSVSSAPVAERDLLAEAVEQVETAKWPEPQSAPMMSWITGGGDKDRVTKSDAVFHYISVLSPSGARFDALMADAERKLVDARMLHEAALYTAEAPRVSMNDVTLVERAIQTLRQHRDIYTSSAKEIEKAGEPVDPVEIDRLRQSFSEAIRDLSDAADQLADRHDDDRSSTFAAPDRLLSGNPSDL